MATLRKRGDEIRHYILDNVQQHPNDIAHFTATHFSISRQAVNKHIQQLVAVQKLTVSGTTRSRQYALQPLEEWVHRYDLTQGLEEDRVWRNDIEPKLGPLPDNVRAIWHYGVTEMLNNVIDHSASATVDIHLEKTANCIKILIRDNGEGIFKKIQRELGLVDERQALLELAKGKLTTDPDNHSGEGIFFSSRLFDKFWILSGNVLFSHQHEQEKDWLSEIGETVSGTTVNMQLSNTANRTTKQIFDAYTDEEDYSFSKTIVPVRLAQYGDETLISRSQAKRLLARIERFKTVIFDFEGVKEIGQAFADEVFRVFRKHHPEVDLHHVNACKEVGQMISRAEAKREN
jgi:hypothetical protein